MKFLLIFSVVLIISNAYFLAKMLFFKKLSSIDELTDLPNYSYLKSYLTKKKKTNQLALVVIDINNFKAFNRISIHTGDRVLKEFSDVLKQFFKEKALICRYRLGDEFALVFLDKRKTEIEETIRQLTSFLEKYAFKCLSENKDYRISFCMGMSHLDADAVNFDNFFDAAELELARAKRDKDAIGECVN
ncbi:MAG: GGDEF domain-containing protein [Bacteroidales bacterium]